MLSPRDLVYLVDDRFRRALRHRSTAGKHVDQREELERADHARHEHEGGHRPEQRESNPPESPPRIRAIHFGGVVIGARNALQPREKHRRLSTNLCPQREEHQREQRRAGIAEPVRPAQPERSGLIDELPDQRDRDG